MSMPAFWKGLSGSADGRKGSLAWDGCFSRQCRQLATRDFMSFPIRGHHTDCAARSLHFATPMWPSWILSRICFLKLKGTTILSPLTKSPPWRLSSPLMMKKSLAANWTSSLYWGQPWIVYPMAALRFTSFKVSALILASPASDTCHDDWTSLTWAWISSWELLSVVDTGLRDRVLATNMSFPGTYLALTLKRMRRINILWQRSGVSDKSLVFIRGTSGLWSVTTENVLSSTG